MRAGLASIVRAHNLRAVSRMAVQRGGENLTAKTPQEEVNLHKDAAGNLKEIFVLGVDDPDDPDVDRWIV